MAASCREGTQVHLRVRPFNEREQATTASKRCLAVLDGPSLRYTGRDPPANASFGFDRVLGEAAGQAEVFEVRRARLGDQGRAPRARQAPGAQSLSGATGRSSAAACPAACRRASRTPWARCCRASTPPSLPMDRRCVVGGC